MLLAAGCGPASAVGQEENASTRAPLPAGNTAAAAAPSALTRPATIADQGTIEALLGDHFFDPQVLVVKVGTTVKWRNSSGTHCDLA